MRVKVRVRVRVRVSVRVGERHSASFSLMYAACEERRRGTRTPNPETEAPPA